MDPQPSWLERLLQEQEQANAAAYGDPWRAPLQRLRGQIGIDGVERVSTQAIFDLLEVPQKSRGGSTTHRLSKLMTELNWTAVRLRRNREQVRGYARYPGSSRTGPSLSISAQQTCPRIKL
jgi:hypothetical protein